jgi:hypothetical protein
MKGIAGTILRLLYVSRMQRWLAGFGLAVMLSALGALTLGWHQATHSLIALAGAVGVVIVVIAPIVAGPILFASLAAPRTTALIPHGRMKLVLGAACTQLLLAMFIAAGLGAMKDAPVHTVFAIAFGALTFFFLGFSLSMYYWPALLVWLPLLWLPRMLAFAFPQLHLGARLVSPRGLLALLAASVLAWVVYGIHIMKSRRGTLRGWNTVGLGSIAANSSRSGASIPPTPRTYTARDALRILLTGNANIRRVIVRFVLFLGAVFIGLTLITADAPQPGGNPAFVFASTLGFMAALIPGVWSGVLGRRARRLWLTAGAGRAELFAAIEGQCWRLIFFAFGMALLMDVPLVAVSNHSAPALNTLVAMATLPLSCGSAVLYAGLLYVRGNRFVDILIIGANTLLLMAVELSAAVNSHAFPALLGSQIILVALLRQVARGRWNHIDWLMLRPPLAAARMT